MAAASLEVRLPRRARANIGSTDMWRFWIYRIILAKVVSILDTRDVYTVVYALIYISSAAC
jgi:hypothetical protein